MQTTQFPRVSRVFIKHWRTENPPPTARNFPAKFYQPVEV